jgi:hypothetical protein
MWNLALATISTAEVVVGLSSTPASASTFMANPPPDYALHNPGYEAHASGNYDRTWLQTRDRLGGPGSPSGLAPERPHPWCGCF